MKKYYKSQIEAVENENLEIFFKTKLWLDKYFKKEKPDALKLDLELKGSEFQKSVWKILREIPYGKTTSYKNIALQIAKQKGVEKMSFQAIGSAIGRNPVLIVVPCHRVIAQNGGLGGFSAGLDTKIKLLKHENPDFNFN